MNIGSGGSQNVFRQKSAQNLSSTMDFLPGVEFGSHTLLNTKQFMYYSYFSRMKDQLSWRWKRLFKEEMPSFFNFKRGKTGPGLFFYCSLCLSFL